MKKLFTILFLFIVCISNAQTVSISSSAAPSNTICSGTNVTFTANISGFTNPSYKWYANGTEIPGAISSTYSSTSLTNGVQVYVKVTGATVDGAIVTNGLRFNLDAGNSASYAGSGTRWTDLSGNGNHGTLSGATLPTYSPDNGGSFVFDGSSSNVNLNKNASAIGIYDNSYTADAWVYPTNLGGDRGMFGDEQAASRQGLHLIFRGGSIHQGHFGSDANAGSVTANSWYHIVFTYNKVTEETRIYKNGAYQGNGGIASYIGTTNIHLGQAYNNTGFFQGKGAVYKMYNRVLSGAEVATNYNALKDRFTSNGVNSNSNIITTTVNPAPSIPVITVNGDGCVNKTSLTTTSGLTSYVWYKDNIIISGITTNTFIPNAIGDYKVVVSNGSCSNTSSVTNIYNCGINANGKAVSIANTSSLISREGGAYLGTAKDISGKIFNTTTLTTLSAATIRTTSAVLGGAIIGTNGRTSSIGVLYSTDINFGSFLTTSISTNVAAGTYSTTISGLASSTTYYTKSYIINSAGTTYGNVVSFATAAPPPPASFSFSSNQISGNLPNYYITTNNLTLSQLPTAWTIQWTYRLDQTIASTDGMHWFFRNPSTTGKYSTDMHLYQINGDLQLWYNNSYTNTDAIMTGLTQGTIYKIALTYDGTNLRTYSNGSLVSTKAINITVKPSNSSLVMGSNVARTLDEFRIWNSALTQPQIAANQSISVAGSSGLMLYYNFNDGTAGANNTGITSIADQSGNNRNGVFTNTALTGTVNNFVTPIVTGF